MASDYRFLTVWRVAGTVDEVKAVFSDAQSLPQWWPSVYLGAHTIEEGSEGGVGRVVEVHTKGWLPYTLRWAMHVTEPLTDTGFGLEATGDFVGTGKWTFAPDGPEVEITYDWRIRATKPLLSRSSRLLRPFFAANHRWAMARGEESLGLELRRRRAADEAERRRVPEPPPTTFARLVRPRLP